MKKLLFLILAATFLTVQAFARIPAKITDAFQARYAGATNVEWRHNIGRYKAIFNLGEYQMQAKFDRKGKWLESEKMLKKEMLPMTIKNSLSKSKYRQWKIKSFHEEYLPNEKSYYQITVVKGDFNKKSLMFDHQGQLIG
jgi:hypothetical protein